MDLKKAKENFKNETIAMLVCIALVICATNHLPDFIATFIVGGYLVYAFIIFFKRDGKQKVKTETKLNDYPSRCPVAGLPFFMAIEHPEKGMIPTYGGPYDSYPIPEPTAFNSDENEQEMIRERFDHDEGNWRNEYEIVPFKICNEEYLIKIESERDALVDAMKPIIEEIKNRHGSIDGTWNDDFHLEITITVAEAKKIISEEICRKFIKKAGKK